ncbi:MAG TPA: DUF1697 domain-containing protein [Caulobacteraceae bacterium]|nr:DUF1697 domain-containing protein [Caulobacteraceae bacterium]
MALTPQVALFRAVNVGGRKATSPELKALAEELGLEDARTLLQSGNLVFRSARSGADLEAEIERAFAIRFGFASDVLVRDGRQWRAVLAANPHAEMAERDPSHLVVMPLKTAPERDAVGALQAAIQGRETLAAVGRELFIAYPDGIGDSKFTGAVIERRLGVRGTARNWNTATKLAAMLQA